MTLLKEYRQRVEQQHGWQVQLKCKVCSHVGLPECEGWTATGAKHDNERPTIFSDLVCSNCAADFKEEAGEKLVELFSEIAPPARNKRLLVTFVTLTFVIPLLMLGGILWGIQQGSWTARAFLSLIVLPALIGPAIMWFNYRIASIRQHCECGKADYLLMGLLGRSYCYRCSTCGRFLRLRD